MSKIKSKSFDFSRLPAPLRYYMEHEGFTLSGSGEWRSSICPFHNDRRPSLRVNVETGAFRCMACNVKGGSVIAFHRARHGLSFMQAARDLGAWISR